MKINVNIDDKFMAAIEEYNNTALKSQKISKMSYEEKRGIVYNSLRRQFNTICDPRRGRYQPTIKVEDIECTFSEDNKLVGLKILKEVRYPQVWSDDDLNSGNLFSELRKVISTRKVIYPTTVLNELYLLTQSI